MKTIAVKGTVREAGSKGARKLRNEGMVPCVVYGGEAPVHVSVDERDFVKVYKTPHVYLVQLDLDGKQHNCIVKDIQFHPVTDRPIHVDFFEVSNDVPFEIAIPVTTKGTARGVLNGGVLKIVRRRVRLKGLLNDIPEVIELDITRLRIGHSIKINQLSYPGLEYLEPAGGDVVAVKAARGALEDEEEEEEEEGAEGAEGAEGGEKAEGEAKPAAEGEAKKEEAAEA